MNPVTEGNRDWVRDLDRDQVSAAFEGVKKRTRECKEESAMMDEQGVDTVWVRNFLETKDSLFRLDTNTSNPEVREDTISYMELSVLRYMQALHIHGIDKSRYTFYWDKGSLDPKNVVRPAVRHAFQVHDWKLGFNEQEMLRYHDMERDHLKLRGKRVQLFQEYILRVRRDLGLPVHNAGEHTVEDILYNFDDVLATARQEWNTVTKKETEIIIAGPYTEALKYVHSASIPCTIVANLGDGRNGYTWYNENINADRNSAYKFLEWALNMQKATCFRFVSTTDPFLEFRLTPTGEDQGPFWDRILPSDSIPFCWMSLHLKDSFASRPEHKNEYYVSQYLAALDVTSGDDEIQWTRILVFQIDLPSLEDFTQRLIVPFINDSLNSDKDREKHCERHKGFFILQRVTCRNNYDVPIQIAREFVASKIIQLMSEMKVNKVPGHQTS
ncbi:hypothetical protein BDV96DRAFT_593959 [Lophiotrema nucula]|uniref:Uncharacterized protein n=1 Tax=Lophiotrema nucula TaxID=690887 RepID=A0A6A5ZRB5_9PLEO|nr:hypothetical protein BDV96DRAFT_593959 [Lophiotrema nucula]